jgi:translation initiation factor IF-2
VNSYTVIYEVIDEIRGRMEGRLGAIEERSPLGEAEVRAVFGSGSKKVAGCMVTEGILRKGCLVVVSIPHQKETKHAEVRLKKRGDTGYRCRSWCFIMVVPRNFLVAMCLAKK